MIRNNFFFSQSFNQLRTQAIEDFFNALKSKLEKKKSLTYKGSSKTIETVLKNFSSKTYQNFIKDCYFNFKQYQKKKIYVKKL